MQSPKHSLDARAITIVVGLCLLWGLNQVSIRAANSGVSPIFQAALDAQTWQEREKHMSAAYEHLAQMHNGLGITGPIPIEVKPFYSRPYLVPGKCNPGAAIYEKIADENVKRLPKCLGSVDQITNLVCVRDRPDQRARMAALYGVEDQG